MSRPPVINCPICDRLCQMHATEDNGEGFHWDVYHYTDCQEDWDIPWPDESQPTDEESHAE